MKKRNVDLNINQMLVKPVSDGHISSPYGDRIVNNTRQFHTGLDIGSPTHDAEILSICTGLIEHASFSKSFGNRVWMKCLDGPYKGLYVVYGHMKSLNQLLEVGHAVLPGTLLGIMGTTGLSYGIHLHIEVADSMGPDRHAINPIEISKLYNK